jgi:heat shock protein HslJ
MKRSLLIALIGAAILFSACHSAKTAGAGTNNTNTDANSITGRKWRLTELYGKPVAETINGKMPFILLQDTGSRYSASAGCNGLGGSFTLSGNSRIKFSQGMSTMMACDNMEIETGFKKVLEQTDNYTVDGNTLSFNKARAAPLARFEAEESTVTQELNGTWELDYISGPRIAFEGLYPDKKPFITFSLPETRATGNSSCNSFNVTFIIDGSNIKFNPPASIRMACPGSGEAVFFNTLKTVTKYSVTGNTLNLIMGDIAVMRFRKKEN